MRILNGLSEPAYQTHLLEANATSKILVLPDGSTLTIRDHSYPQDDLYCFINGWYQLDRVRTANDYADVEEVSQTSCNALQARAPNYDNVSMDTMNAAAGGVAVEQLLELLSDSDSEGEVQQSTLDGLRVLAAGKCLMSNMGPVCDITNCARRGCLDGTQVNFTV